MPRSYGRDTWGHRVYFIESAESYPGSFGDDPQDTFLAVDEILADAPNPAQLDIIQRPGTQAIGNLTIGSVSADNDLIIPTGQPEADLPLDTLERF